MPNALQIFSGIIEADDESLCKSFGSIEVEESVELPGAIEIIVPLDATPARDLTRLGDASIQPYANLAIVVHVEGRPSECIFDGYVLSHKLHLETGTASSSLKIWGQDASWLMNLEEHAREWTNMSDGQIANAIFGAYEFTPTPDNIKDDSPLHTESGHSLMQRSTDIQFLRQLARRNGKFCRVACTNLAGARIGYFYTPDLTAAPAVTLTLNPPSDATVHALDFEWDVARPSDVAAKQTFFDTSGAEVASGDSKSAELGNLEARPLVDFIRPNFEHLKGISGIEGMKVMLTAPADVARELSLRARSVLREAGFFVRCTGEVEVSQIKAVLRAGMIVQIDGAGSVNSGKYLVWSVRHTIKPDSHKMSFVLVRNAVGPASTGGS